MQDYRFIFILIIVLVTLFFLFYCYVINKKSSLYEDKFNSFALPSNSNSRSLLDLINDILWKFIRLISEILSKSKILSMHSKSFDIYVTYSDNQKVKGIDILSIKILFALVMFITTFILSIINFIDVTYLFVVLISVFAYFVPNYVLDVKYNSISKNVNNDIISAIMILNTSLKSGKSINEATYIVSKELDGAISNEFLKISKDISYGIDVTEAFNRFYNRVSLDSTKFISETLLIYKNLGSNLINVFDYIEKELVNNSKTDKNLLSTTIEARFIYKLVLILPFLVFVCFSIIDTSLFISIFINPTGAFILIAIIALYILYIVLMKMVMQVKL